MKKNFSNAKGFSLIELLVVIAIIGILSTLAMVNFLGVKQRARDAQRKVDLRQIQSAIELYKADQGAYPPAPLPNCGSPLTAGTATYMKKIPCDPQNTGQLKYTYTATGTAYTLYACVENTSDGQKDTANNGTYC